MAGIEGIRR